MQHVQELMQAFSSCLFMPSLQIMHLKSYMKQDLPEINVDQISSIGSTTADLYSSFNSLMSQMLTSGPVPKASS